MWRMANVLSEVGGGYHILYHHHVFRASFSDFELLRSWCVVNYDDGKAGKYEQGDATSTDIAPHLPIYHLPPTRYYSLIYGRKTSRYSNSHTYVTISSPYSSTNSSLGLPFRSRGDFVNERWYICVYDTTTTCMYACIICYV